MRRLEEGRVGGLGLLSAGTISFTNSLDHQDGDALMSVQLGSLQRLRPCEAQGKKTLQCWIQEKKGSNLGPRGLRSIHKVEGCKDMFQAKGCIAAFFREAFDASKGRKHMPRASDSVLGHQSEFPTVSLVFISPITRFQVLFCFVLNKSGDIAQAKYSRYSPEK